MYIYMLLSEDRISNAYVAWVIWIEIWYISSVRCMNLEELIINNTITTKETLLY